MGVLFYCSKEKESSLNKKVTSMKAKIGEKKREKKISQ